MRRNLASLIGLSAMASLSGGLVVARAAPVPKTDEERIVDEGLAATPPPAAKPTRKGGGGFREKMTVEEAMQRTGTSTPKQALAKLNEGRVGRNRLSYLPHTGERARKRYLKQLEKERAAEARKAAAAT